MFVDPLFYDEAQFGYSENPEVQQFPNEPNTEKTTSQSHSKQWGKTRFLLCASGFSLSLGSIWRFPFLAQKYDGGVFLVLYIVFSVLIGIPMLYMEVSLGKFGSCTVVDTFNCVPIFKGLGIVMVLISFLISICQHIFVVYVFDYLLTSIYSINSLPWASCNNTYNTIDCRDFNQTSCDQELCAEPIHAAEEYFVRSVLSLANGFDSGNLYLSDLTFGSGVATAFVAFFIINGFYPLLKTMLFFMVVFLFTIGCFTINLLTTESGHDGLGRFFHSSLLHLTNYDIWEDALTQVLYSFSISTGTLYAFGAHMNFRQRIISKHILWIFVFNIIGSSLIAIFHFSLVGYVSDLIGANSTSPINGERGFSIIVYSIAAIEMPMYQIFTIVIFFTLTFLEIYALSILVEIIIKTVNETCLSQYVKNYSYIVCTFCLVMLFFGIRLATNVGMYWLIGLDYFTVRRLLLLTATAEALIIAYVYTVERLKVDIKLMNGKKPGKFYTISWNYVTPTILLIISILSFFPRRRSTEDFLNADNYPYTLSLIGWLVLINSFLFVLGWAFYQTKTRGGTWRERFQIAKNPNLSWRPFYDEDCRNTVEILEKSTETFLQPPVSQPRISDESVDEFTAAVVYDK